MSSWKITVPSILEPVSLTEAKNHLKVTSTSEDVVIQGYLDTAIQESEEYCRQSFLTQTVEEVFTEFKDGMCLRFAPVQSISSITYYDSDNASQTLATSVYDLDDWQKPCQIRLKVDQTFPSVANRFDAIKVTYISGWTQASLVPAPIKTAIKMKLAHYFLNRSDEKYVKTAYPAIRTAANNLLNPYRVYTV